MAKKPMTISLANTPVQRALARAKRSSLIILFILGITCGFVYKAFFSGQPTDAATDPAVSTEGATPSEKTAKRP